MQLLLDLARLDCDAVWLELLLVASQGSPTPLQSPEPRRFPPLAAVLLQQPSSLQPASQAAGARAKQALRLLHRIEGLPVRWHDAAALRPEH